MDDEGDENEKHENNEHNLEASIPNCRDPRALELQSLRQGMDNLEAVLEKMMASHRAEITNLQCQLQCCSGDVQSGLDNVTKLMAEQAEQADSLLRACMTTCTGS